MFVPLTVHGATHPGLVHDHNDDSFTVIRTDEGGVLLVVCDGMGGMGHGDEASALAVQVLTDHLRNGAGYPPERLRQAIRRADTVVRETLCDQGRGFPGSTAVLVYVLDGQGHVAWVGDSRAYLVRRGEVVERTTDHKLVTELIAAGQLTLQEAKKSPLAHVVTRALGGRAPGERAVQGATLAHPWKLEQGDMIVLCSDGVTDLVEDAELPPLVLGKDAMEAVSALVAVSLERGGHDNITAVVARWEGQAVREDEIATPLMTLPRDLSPEAFDQFLLDASRAHDARKSTAKTERPEDPSGRELASGSPSPGVPDGGDSLGLEDLPFLDDRTGAERVTEEIPADHPLSGTPARDAAPSLPVSEPVDPRAQPGTRGSQAPAAPPPAPADFPVEGGRAWLVVAAAILVLLLVAGLILAGS